MDIINHNDWFLSQKRLLENIEREFVSNTRIEQMRECFTKQSVLEVKKIRQAYTDAGGVAEFREKLFTKTRIYINAYKKVEVLLNIFEREQSTRQEDYVKESCKLILDSFKDIFRGISSDYAVHLPPLTPKEFPEMINYLWDCGEEYYNSSNLSAVNRAPIIIDQNSLRDIVSNFAERAPSSERSIKSLAINNFQTADIQERIKSCYNRLNRDGADNRFISHTTLLCITKIFSNDEVQSKIKWVGTDAELSYFINGVKSELSSRNDIWKRSTSCFEGENQKQFKNTTLSSPNNNVSQERANKLNLALWFFTGNSKYQGTNFRLIQLKKKKKK